MRPPAGQNAAPASAEVPRSSPRRAAAAARNLGAAAGSPHAGGTRSGVLAGLTLMVTGYAGDVAERQRVCRLIQANGGALLSEVPPPEQVRPPEPSCTLIPPEECGCLDLSPLLLY